MTEPATYAGTLDTLKKTPFTDKQPGFDIAMVAYMAQQRAGAEGLGRESGDLDRGAELGRLGGDLVDCIEDGVRSMPVPQAARISGEQSLRA